MKARTVYVDHAAATPLDERVFEAMKPFFSEAFANPSSFHMPGKRVRDAVEEARARIATVLGARPDELLFTSGGTESDNMAVLGVARQYISKGKHLISTKVEHEAVIESLYQLEKDGFEVTYVDVDAYGRVEVQDVLAAIRPDTTLISLILANNEIGTINPIQELGQALQKKKAQGEDVPFLHTDACQALGSIDIRVDRLGVDLMTINGSKIYGPKGVGALYVRRGVKVKPLHAGGSQERGIRPGTENVPAIMGFAKAVEIADEQREAYVDHLTPLRDQLIEGLSANITKTRLNGHATERLPNNVNMSFLDVEGEALLLYLDAAGIYASTGSACTSKSLDPSHVILALGVPYEVAHGSLRFTLGRSTTKEDIAYIIETLPPLVEKLRRMSPVNVQEKYYET